MRMLLGLFVLAAVLSPLRADAATYTLDESHTTISFKVRHIFTWVHGTFRTFKGQFVYEPGQPENWNVQAEIDVSSIDTGQSDRDGHLRSPDFFNVETYPTMSFESTQITDATEGRAKILGLLTLHGVKKPVELDLEIHGVAKDPWGHVRAGFTATTTLARKDFGITWNKVLDTGQLLVGEEAVITIEVEGIRQT